jgi:hypothetical protein
MCFLLDYYDNMILLLFIDPYQLNEVSHYSGLQKPGFLLKYCIRAFNTGKKARFFRIYG